MGSSGESTHPTPPKPSKSKRVNMDHDLVEKFKEKLDSFPASDYHGLKSPGLTCYLNSVLQVLFMTEDFREAVKGCKGPDSTTMDADLRKLFAVLQTSVARTDDIIFNLEITNVYQQRDAAEYFEKILCLTSPEATEVGPILFIHLFIRDGVH